jgi:hypothetical protein
MTSVEDKLRAAIRAKVREIETDSPPPLRLPARRRRSVFLAYGGGEKGRTPLGTAWRRWLAPAACGVLVGAIAVAAVTVPGSRYAPSSPIRPRAAHVTLRQGSDFYLGVYAAGAPPRYGPVVQFAKAAGKQPNLVGYFSSWQEPFSLAFATTLHDRGVVPLVQIDPTDTSLAAIAAGRWDGYLSSFAARVRAFGHAIVIGFGHEMNAPWYSWGYGHVRPAVFVAAWRHVFDLFRAEGATNVTWLWTIQADGPGTGPVASWWPGSAYVDWVGIDGFYARRSDTFATVFGPTIAQVRQITSKPTLVSETAVSQQPEQPAQIRDLFHSILVYRLLGLVWFNEAPRGTQQDWRIQDNPAAEIAFRRGVSTLTRR